MRKFILLCLMATAFFQVKAQNYCLDEVVTNLDADIQFAQTQVHLSWGFDPPPNPNCPVVCPPLLVSYEVQVEFGIRTQGPSGPITWFQSNVYNHIELDIHLVHDYDVPITSKFERVRFRVKVVGCSNWEDWVTTSIWD